MCREFIVSDIFGGDGDLFGEYSERDYDEELRERAEFEPTYTLYGGGEHWLEPFTMTGPQWIGEAFQGQYETEELYGLNPVSIVEQLIDAGYDYEIISPITGEWISGVWEDWRELYGEVA